MLGFCKPHFSAICVIDAPSVHCSSIPQKQPLKLWKNLSPPCGRSRTRSAFRSFATVTEMWYAQAKQEDGADD
jgi:hypothetical protein